MFEGIPRWKLSASPARGSWATVRRRRRCWRRSRRQLT